MKKTISAVLSFALMILLSVNVLASEYASAEIRAVNLSATTTYTRMKITEKTYAFASADETSEKLYSLYVGYRFTPIDSISSYWKVEFIKDHGAIQYGYVPKKCTRVLEVDTDLILSAYRSGNENTLTGKNKTILDICKSVIEKSITADMSDYEKELAIHDWIIDRANYDTEVVNRSPNAKPDPDNDNPYGVLVGGRGVCDGYSSTFKLFMDMLGIECITVRGSSFEGLDEITVRGIVYDNLDVHGWNMVRLDGEWYCVDLSWNDIFDTNETNRHYYFNVTSDLMRKNNHNWDESTVPEATAIAFAWQPGMNG